MVVVDQSDSYLSREFTRRVNATPDVEVVGVCPDMAEAKKMLDEKKAYGILLFPPDYSKDLHEGRQTTVSLYCDMSALLFYKAFLLATTEVSLDMGKELRMHNNPSSTDKMDQITVDPIPYESVALFNSQNGFASFLVPAILILVLQQTLILGIGMLGGTAREKNRFHSLVPICRHFNGTLRIVFGKSLTYLLLYVVVCIWVLAIVPKLFSLPQVGEPLTILLFLLPYLFACIFMSMTLSGFMTSRESPMLVFVSRLSSCYLSRVSLGRRRLFLRFGKWWVICFLLLRVSRDLFVSIRQALPCMRWRMNIGYYGFKRAYISSCLVSFTVIRSYVAAR